MRSRRYKNRRGPYHETQGRILCGQGGGSSLNVTFQGTPQQEEPSSSERDVPLKTDALFGLDS